MMATKRFRVYAFYPADGGRFDYGDVFDTIEEAKECIQYCIEDDKKDIEETKKTFPEHLDVQYRIQVFYEYEDGSSIVVDDIEYIED